MVENTAPTEIAFSMVNTDIKLLKAKRIKKKEIAIIKQYAIIATVFSKIILRKYTGRLSVKTSFPLKTLYEYCTIHLDFKLMLLN